MTESEAKELKNMTANQLFDILGSYPYPGATNLSGGAMGFMCFKVDGLWVAYDRGMWNVELHETQYPITPNFPPFGELTVRDVHAEISRVVKIGKSLHADTRATVSDPATDLEKMTGKLPTVEDVIRQRKNDPTFVSTDRYRELEAELAKITAERDELSVRVKQKTDVIVAQAAQIQQHSDGWEQTDAQLEAMTTSRDATQERVEALQQLLPLLCLGVNAPVDQVREKIEGLYGRIKKFGLLSNELSDQLKTVTEERDEAQKKNDFINGQMSDLLAERERLFAQIKALTEERDGNESSYNYAQNLLNQVWDATGWLERADNEPCGIEYIKRLKSKADRAGLLSVVCRRLCGDENASIETVHKALNLFDDQRNALDYIGEKVYCDADPDAPHRLQAIGRLAAQMSKSLSEKTVEVSKLQEGLTNYKAQVEGLTKRVEQLAFERDTERVGNKWLSETIEDLKRTTVKLPNEHTLRRLFNRHGTPEKYDDGTTIPTIERLLLIIENLCRNADCAERRFEELNAISTRVDTESEDAHATLDEMGIPRWTTVGNHNERYLSLSARLRQLFATHTKV